MFGKELYPTEKKLKFWYIAHTHTHSLSNIDQENRRNSTEKKGWRSLKIVENW